MRLRQGLCFFLLLLPCTGRSQDSLRSGRQQRRIEALHQIGYLEAGWTAREGKQMLYRGPRYYCDSLIAPEWPVFPAIRPEQPMRTDKLDAHCREQLKLALASGYPFASIRLQFRPYRPGRCVTEVIASQGPQFTWDTLLFSG